MYGIEAYRCWGSGQDVSGMMHRKLEHEPKIFYGLIVAS
jgi:hypothetical protein